MTDLYVESLLIVSLSKHNADWRWQISLSTQTRALKSAQESRDLNYP